MASRQHKIRRVVFEIKNSNETTYKSDENELSRLLQEYMALAMEQVMDEADVSHRDVLIPEMEIDLGVLTKPFEKDEIVALFREKLRSQLAVRIGHIAEDKTTPRDPFEALIYFLENGNLPWWADKLLNLKDFENQRFAEILKAKLRSSSSEKWIKRLVRQFSFEELQYLMESLAGGRFSENLRSVEKVMARLMRSNDTAKRRYGVLLTENVLKELVSGEDSVRDLPEQIMLLSTKAHELKRLDVSQLANLLSEPSLITSPKMKELLEALHEEKEISTNTTDTPNISHTHEETVSGKHESQKKSELETETNSFILYYLEYGSFQDAQVFSYEQVLSHFPEFVIRFPGKVRNALKTRYSQELILQLISNLSLSSFRLLAATFIRDDEKTVAIRKKIKESEVHTPERAIGAALVLTGILKSTSTTALRVYERNENFLLEKEKTELKEIRVLNGELIGAETTKEPGEVPTLSSAYLSDLIRFLLKHRSIPWWSTQFEKNSETEFQSGRLSFGALLKKVVGYFASTNSSAFSAFAKDLLHNQKGVMQTLATVDETTAKTLVNKALPFYKNNFTDTLKAVIELILLERGYSFHPDIVSYQISVALLEQKGIPKDNFRDLLNTVIGQLAARYQIPLWEVYRTLLKHYAELNLKQPLSKEEANNLFTYHESLEEKYSDWVSRLPDEITRALKQESRSDSIMGLEFVSEKHRDYVLDYISGEPSTLRFFPAPWAFGKYMAYGVEKGSIIQKTIEIALLESSVAYTYRTIELEEMTEEKWIKNVPGIHEDEILPEELTELLVNHVQVPAYELKKLIRSFFIFNRYWIDEKFTADRLNKLLQFLSIQTGIELSKLQSGILIQISNEVGYPQLREHFEYKGRGTEPEQLPASNDFISSLRRVSENNIVEQVLSAWRTLSGKILRLYLFKLHLRGVHTKTELNHLVNGISWLQGSSTLVRALEGIHEESTVDVVKAIIKAIENEEKKAGSVSRVFKFAKLIEEFVVSSDIKDALLDFIEENKNAGRQVFVQHLNSLPDLEAKEQLVKFVSENFQVTLSPVGEPLVDSEQLEKLKWWREKLGFDNQLPGESNQKPVVRKSENDEIVPTNLQKDNRLPEHNFLSKEFIFDIAEHFFYYLELPWWSPVKEITDFEKLFAKTVRLHPQEIIERLQSMAVEMPTVLAMFEAEFSNQESRQLADESGTIASRFIKSIQNSISFIDKITGLEEIKVSIQSLMKGLSEPELSLNVGSEGEFVNAKKLITAAIFATGSEAMSNLIAESEGHDKQEWFSLLEQEFRNEKIRLNRFPELSEGLFELEKKLETEKLLFDLPITEVLFLVTANEPQLSPDLIASVWMQSFQISSGLGVNVLKNKIMEIASPESVVRQIQPLLSEAIHSLNATKLPQAIETLLAGALVVQKANDLSSVQKLRAWKFLGFLLSDRNIPETQSFEMFLVYLQGQGISGDKQKDILETIIPTADTGIKEILQTWIHQLENKFTATQKAKTQHEDPAGDDFIILSEKVYDKFVNGTNTLETWKKVSEQLHQQESRKAEVKPRQHDVPAIDLDGRIYVPNAGLVILWPFFTRLFSNLKYTEKGQFIDEEKQERAVHLTQYLVGFSEDYPEHTLTLNKLLCGIDLRRPLERTVHLTEEEKNEAENMLNAVLAQWKEMNNTSPANFQRTFLQREGVIYQKNDNWQVKVDHTVFDILLLKLPWGLSMIKYPWNNYLIFVEWKAMN